jgi:hypothetical protein
MMELKEREQIIKDLQEIVDNYSGGWKRFNVLDGALSLIKELVDENEFHRKTISENAQMALEVTIDEIEKARAEIVQKFADYLKKKSFCCDTENWMSFDAIDIDELDGYVKEFLEENK